MANTDLDTYISKLRASNHSDNDIKAQLIKVGWSEPEIQQALLPENSPMPDLPPPPVPRFSLWISFQYILLFVTLWVWSIALGGIWHYAIDKHIAELAANTSSDYLSSINEIFLQGYLAAIIVAYPFFAVFFIMLKKQIERYPGIRNIKTRKVLIYFTMIVNFIYMLTQLIKTVFNFLNATTSTRLLPHLFVNLIIPGLICAYLLREVQEDRKVLT